MPLNNIVIVMGFSLKNIVQEYISGPFVSTFLDLFVTFKKMKLNSLSYRVEGLSKRTELLGKYSLHEMHAQNIKPNYGQL